MSSVEEIFECPKCGKDCGYVFDCTLGEEWCSCLNPECDYGWKHILTETGWEEIVGKVEFHQIQYSELHPIEQLPIKIMVDSIKEER